MAKKKFYAVREGRKTGIYRTWDECKEQVDGFPGAQYMGFVSKNEAESYLKEKANDCSENNVDATYYVDGSYDPNLSVYGYGYVLVKNGKEIEKYKGYGTDQAVARLRNVTGEMIAAMSAVKDALKKGYKSIKICYDYNGIANWVNGAWKYNSEFTEQYAWYMTKWKDKMDIKFQKVKAHSDDKYNNMADKLAKCALNEAFTKYIHEGF